MILYFGDVPEQTETTVPDFTGMNRQQANDAAGTAGLYIQIRGNTSLDPGVTVTAQSRKKGEQIPTGSTVVLEFADTQAAD